MARTLDPAKGIRTHQSRSGAVTFQVPFRANGTRTSLTFDTQTEAVKFRHLLIALGGDEALRRHLGDAQEASPSESRTVAQVVEHHIDHLTGVTERTRSDYRRDNRNHIAPTALGRMPIDLPGRDDIKAWVNDRITVREPKTVRNIHGLLAAAFDTATDNGWCRRNPCKGVRLPTADHDADEEMVFLEHDEFALLHGCLPEWARPLSMFLVGTGMRWSEATALQIADLDLARATVRVRRAWKRQPDNTFQLGPPKTKKSRRTVDLPSELVDMLRPMVKGRTRDDFVFTSRTGAHVRHSNFYNRAWLPAVANARVKGLGKSPRIHDLRHTHASWCIAANVPLPVIRERLGHESITTTVDRYGHLMSGLQAAAAMAVGAALPRPAIETAR